MTHTDSDLERPLSWAQRLVETRDIDPIYDMLYQAMVARAIGSLQVGRWMIAYWCLYHAGAASRISEHSGSSFWDELMMAAQNTSLETLTTGENVRWPRGSERRHWRGKAAVDCVHWLRHMFKEPEQLISGLTDLAGSIPLEQIRASVECLPSFGPWISFKVADMLERVISWEIVFPDDVVFYESPRKGATELAALWNTDVIVAIQRVTAAISQCRPPGASTRLCNVQEVETILCKWHSARGGHYYIGKDLREVRHALDGWGGTANKLLVHLPPLNDLF